MVTEQASSGSGHSWRAAQAAGMSEEHVVLAKPDCIVGIDQTQSIAFTCCIVLARNHLS